MRRRLGRTARRWLYLSHRWVGIITCLFFAMWFTSGVVMMYVAFPNFSEKERLASLPNINWERVALTPDDAMKVAGATQFPRDLRLNMLAEEPVYRLTHWDNKRQTISAVDGRTVSTISEMQALAIAASHSSATAVRHEGMVERDQWSVTARYDPLRPLHLIALGDEANTKLYVSSRSGEIVLDTNGTERFWNWLGAIPHWIYPTVLRKDGPLWRLVVLWISGICLIVGISGIWIGILRMRLRRRYASDRITPYRGWMAWHHLTGLVAGLFILTWMFSGWLSLNPGNYFSNRNTQSDALRRYAGQIVPTISSIVPTTRPQAVEARFVWLGGDPMMILASRDGTKTPTQVASGEPVVLPSDRIWKAAAQLLPDSTLKDRTVLKEYDAYWYAHHNERELPVIRVTFDDSSNTWFHISPVTGDILGRSDDSRRTYRWLFNALHSFDFKLLLAYRPAWDIIVWGLSILGTIVSISGVVIGWRYLVR